MSSLDTQRSRSSSRLEVRAMAENRMSVVLSKTTTCGRGKPMVRVPSHAALVCWIIACMAVGLAQGETTNVQGTRLRQTKVSLDEQASADLPRHIPPSAPAQDSNIIKETKADGGGQVASRNSDQKLDEHAAGSEQTKLKNQSSDISGNNTKGVVEDGEDTAGLWDFPENPFDPGNGSRAGNLSGIHNATDKPVPSQRGLLAAPDSKAWGLLNPLVVVVSTGILAVLCMVTAVVGSAFFARRSLPGARGPDHSPELTEPVLKRLF